MGQRGKRRELRCGLADTHLNSVTLTSRAYNLSVSVNSSIGVRAFPSLGIVDFIGEFSAFNLSLQLPTVK